MLQRARPQFGLLAAIANASTLTEEVARLVYKLTDDENADEAVHEALADIYSVASDVRKYLDSLADAAIEEELP